MYIQLQDYSFLIAFTFNYCSTSNLNENEKLC